MSLLSLWIARRYLISPKSHSVINLISIVSAFTVAIPVAAMIVLLSVFNGFDGLIRQMYKNFDPDIRIEAARGKFFKGYPSLSGVEGVQSYSEMVEQTALFEYQDHQFVGTMRGVDSMYKNVIPIEQTLTRGRWQPEFGEINQAILGQGVAHSLGVNVHIYYPLKVYVPKNGPVSPFLPVESVKGEKLFPVGVFSLDAQSDGEYVIVPLRFAQTLVGEKKVSAIAVKLVAGADPNQVKHNLQQLLGDDFVIKTHSEQKQSVYRIMQYEKWGIYTILLLVMVIGAFGIVGALVMLIMEKHRDIETLTAMGLTRDKLKMIFINEGLLIALIGGLIGGVFGGALCWGQARWGWVKLQGQSFLIDYYPVDVHFVDVLLVYLSVVVVAWLMSLITVSVTLRSYKK
jgi:lipoprotein-releasing system permease protein